MSGYGVGDRVGGFEESKVLFEESKVLFEAMVEWLSAPGTGELTHAELEECVAQRGRELQRQLFQDHADLRAVREVRLDRVQGSDRVVRSRVEGGHRRRLATVFGVVDTERKAYRASGVVNLYPADAGWNLPDGLASHGLRRLVAIESTRGSFAAAQAAIERATGVRIGKRQVEGAAVAAAADIGEFCNTRRPEPVASDQVLVITCDGKGVVMRPAALRAPTAKAAAAAVPKMATRVSPGEKRHRKRMAELVCVYDVDPVERTPADIIATPGARTDRAETKPPVATGKWLTASLVDDAAQVIAAGFDEAERRDPGHERPWVALVDGNNHQIDTITGEATHRNIKVDIVIDFIHVAEYVWGAAWSFFHTGDPDAESWVGEQLRKILHGKATQVAAGIRRRASTFGFRDTERAGADRCADYLTAKADYLAYDEALAAGWPIATGVIEGACRYIVKDRLDITGARWGLAGAEAIMRLRALHSNGDFDEYWRYHLRKEHHRNHQTRYQRSDSDYALAA